MTMTVHRNGRRERKAFDGSVGTQSSKERSISSSAGDGAGGGAAGRAVYSFVTLGETTTAWPVSEVVL